MFLLQFGIDNKLVLPLDQCMKINLVIPMSTTDLFLTFLKVPYYEKHIFSGVYIYKLVLPEPANYQNEENKLFLHGLCSPPTG